MPGSRAKSSIEEATLNALADRLEGALELVASADMAAHLAEIERLCLEAAALAKAGRLLLAK